MLALQDGAPTEEPQPDILHTIISLRDVILWSPCGIHNMRVQPNTPTEIKDILLMNALAQGCGIVGREDPQYAVLTDDEIVETLTAHMVGLLHEDNYDAKNFIKNGSKGPRKAIMADAGVTYQNNHYIEAWALAQKEHAEAIVAETEEQ